MIPNFDSINVTKRYEKNFHNKKGRKLRKEKGNGEVFQHKGYKYMLLPPRNRCGAMRRRITFRSFCISYISFFIFSLYLRVFPSTFFVFVAYRIWTGLERVSWDIVPVPFVAVRPRRDKCRSCWDTRWRITSCRKKLHSRW